MQRIARASAASTRNLLDETERVLARLAQHAEVRALRADRCDPAIEDFRASVGYVNIITVSAEGLLTCSALPVKQGHRVSVTGQAWYEHARRAKGLHLGRPMPSVVSGATVVYATYPLPDGGLIAAALDLSNFEPVAEAEHALIEDTVISIIDAEGYMVARSSEARSWIGRNVRGQGVVDTALRQKEGYATAPGLHGIERVFGFAPVPGTSWVVYAGVRSDAVFAPARAAAWRSAGIALGVIAVLALLVTLAAGRIAAPIRAIGCTARSVAHGRLDARVPVPSAGELQHVASEFNRMLDQQLERERLLQRVTDSAPAIIHVKDAEGRYRLVNQEFERVTGLSAKQVIGRRDAELFPPEMTAAVTRHDRQALESKAPITIEETITARDGSARTYLVGKASVGEPERGYLVCTAAFEITERKRLEERQRQLSRRVFEVSEAERQRLSRELHDRIGQALAALRINIDVLRRDLPAAAGAGLDSQAQLIEEVIRHVRNLTAELRPPELDAIGLLPALRNYAELAAQRYGFEIDVLGREFVPRLPAAAERALFRIAQEALANVAKHANAETVTIELDEVDRDARLAVCDDGAGFAVGARAGGIGLASMRERIEEVGGRLEIESAIGMGTRVIAALPRQ